MELSPKQQAVNEIKNARHLLVLGHRNPDGDQLGSLLALGEALAKIQKSVTLVASDNIPKAYSFLPNIAEIKKEYNYTDGKVLRIDTKRIPVEGMKWQKDEQFLDIHLETPKNLKFEFIEIINGLPKPDLIIAVDTPHFSEIEKVYRENEKIFLETPVLNIDHHPGNEYFGTINLVDLTATSTTEILVSLFEALGVKIDTPDLATTLLTGILNDTNSFQSQNTTPKSLTVAAQLLAAGARQQEIVKNLFGKKPDELIKLWENLNINLEKDEAHKILWSKAESEKFANEELLGEAANGLLEKNPNYELALIFVQDYENEATKIIAHGKNEPIDKLAKIFSGLLKNNSTVFTINDADTNKAEKIVLKKIAENFQPSEDSKQLWDVIEKSGERDETVKELHTNQPLDIDAPNSLKEKQDAIEEALKSISQAEKDENRKEMESLRDVIDRKRANGPDKELNQSDELDIFGDE